MGNFECSCSRDQYESAKDSAKDTYSKVSKKTSE